MFRVDRIVTPSLPRCKSPKKIDGKIIAIFFPYLSNKALVKRPLTKTSSDVDWMKNPTKYPKKIKLRFPRLIPSYPRTPLPKSTST